jgi:transcriptional regulator with XRE-family HTH domain
LRLSRNLCRLVPMTTATIPEWPLHYRVRLALDVADVRPEQAAAELGVHPNTVSNYLAGRTRPRRATLRVIAQMTGVSLRWLETGDESDEGGDSPVTSAVTQRYQRAA